MLLNYSFQATRYIPRPLPKVLATALTAAVLASCGADVSDETAMQESMEVSLAQCEILQYGVVGTPTEPVVVDGEEVNACVLSNDIGQLKNTRDITGDLNAIGLKSSWNYEPLVWVLDGVYEFGASKEYSTLDELIADRVNFGVSAYAKPGSVIIVHRNARLVASSIRSLDDNDTGGGEWGGVIVNGIGASPDCPATASPEALCNIKGPFGYYGGVSASTDLTAYGMGGGTTNSVMGFPGLWGGNSVIGEAGAETQVALEGYEGGTIHAAVTAYAPAAGQVGNVIAYSGSNGLQIYGGSYNVVDGNPVSPTPYITESAGPAVELNEYQGGFSARVNHASNTTAAIHVNGGKVDLSNTTLFDQYSQAGSALALTSASMLSIDDVVIQGFDTCLAPQDSASQISIGSALLNCSNITNSTDNALAAIADATDLITGIDPYLSYIWSVTNDGLSFANVEDISQLGAGNVSVSSNDLYSAAILFPECMDVGTLASDTVQIDNLTYQICDLNPTVAQSATLYSNFSIEGRLDNGGSPDYYPKNIAWRIDGQVQVGTDFTSLSSSEQAAALASPIQLTLASSTKLVATSNNDTELVIQPDAQLRVAGLSAAAVELGVGLSGDITSSWRGITVNGHSDAEQQLDIHYLRLFDTGEDGQAALTLNEVDDNSQIAYLDIYGAGADGLNINGGAVNFDYLVMANIAGDQIQWQNGYTGTIETAIVSPGDDSTGHVLHGINDSTNYDASPRSRPVITNITAAGFGSANTAVLLEQGSGLLMFNSVFSDFATCLDIDDAETAALQSSDPQGILFDGVIFSCENTLAADSEDSGYDYGYTVASSGGVYEEDPVLDTSYVITGDTLAGQASLSSYAGLIGDSYSQLNDAGYIGAVSDSNDNWYNNWSDSVVITPDFECNNLGILTALDSELTAGAYRFGYDTNGDGEISSNEYWYPASKSCRILGGIYTNNVTISQYTGLAGETVEQWLNDGYTLEEIQVDALTGGWAINSSTGETRYIEEAVMRVAPTHWSIKGIVHIGNGHQEITDVDTVAEMKANPVMLTIEAGTELTSENDKSVLHISRAGSLVMIGDPDYSENTYDPENSRGLLNISGIRFVIDGFGRHNQCPNAETTDAGGQVCNIDGEYGYYGGYDNSHSNVDIQYVSFNDNTFLDFNAVGNGLIAHVNIYESSRQSEVRYAININGGSLNIKDIYFDLSAFPEPRSYQGLIEWNYGYTGNIQYLNGIVWIYLPSDEYGNSAVIKGRNNPDNPDSLPRSAPTMANISLYQLPVDGTTFQGGQPGTMMLALYNGSSVNLYNSVLGAESIYMSYYGGTVEQCIGFDDQASSVTAEDINIVNLAAGCENVSFDSRVIENPTYKSSATYTFGVNFDSPNLLSQVAQKAFGVFNLNPVLVGRDFAEFPMLEVVNQGNEKGTNSGNYNESPTADTEFLEQTDYMGMYNYNQNPELIYYLE